MSANVLSKLKGPQFKTSFTTGLVITIVGLVAACVMEFVLRRKNKAGDEREARGEEERKMVGNDGERFRYIL